MEKNKSDVDIHAYLQDELFKETQTTYEGIVNGAISGFLKEIWHKNNVFPDRGMPDVVCDKIKPVQGKKCLFIDFIGNWHIATAARCDITGDCYFYCGKDVYNMGDVINWAYMEDIVHSVSKMGMNIKHEREWHTASSMATFIVGKYEMNDVNMFRVAQECALFLRKLEDKREEMEKDVRDSDYFYNSLYAND